MQYCAPLLLSHIYSCIALNRQEPAHGRESSRRHAGCDVDVKVSWRDTATDIKAFLLAIDLLFTKHKRAAWRGGLTVASRPPTLALFLHYCVICRLSAAQTNTHLEGLYTPTPADIALTAC